MPLSKKETPKNRKHMIRRITSAWMRVSVIEKQIRDLNKQEILVGASSGSRARDRLLAIIKKKRQKLQCSAQRIRAWIEVLKVKRKVTED